MEQLTIFNTLPLEPDPLLTPVRRDQYYDIHGLVYSLSPVDGWLKVSKIFLTRPPDHPKIAGRAWVDPDTINSVHKQEYDIGPPLAWGFEPAKMINYFVGYVKKMMKDIKGGLARILKNNTLKVSSLYFKT